MDIAPSITTTTAANTASTKSPEADSVTPTRIHPAKPLSFSNGVLKRHHHLNHHHNIPVTPVVVAYKECLKNHAATLGGHALDGCGEFMTSPTATPADPTSLKCAACGCHRNFHRRDPEDPMAPTHAATTHVIEYQPHHRHHPPPPSHGGARSPSSASPPPISSSYYPSAPHMLLALSTAHENALGGGANNHSGPGHLQSGPIVSPSPNARKRFRTKFSQDQKDKMYQFAERVGWKIQKRDEEAVKDFCNDICVDKGVLKVWMHNNKNTFAKRDVINGSGGGGGGLISGGGISGGGGGRPNFVIEQTHHHNGNNNNGNHHNDDEDDDDNDEEENEDHNNDIQNPNLQYGGVRGGATNGSSSSS